MKKTDKGSWIGCLYMVKWQVTWERFENRDEL